MTLPLPEAPRTPAQDCLGSGASEILLKSQAERRGVRVSLPLHHPQAVSIVPLVQRKMCLWILTHCPLVSDRCDSRQNKTHTFSKGEQKPFSAYHKHPALIQLVCTAVSTPCHTCRGLAGHPRCVNVGNDYGKRRIYNPIRSKTTAIPLPTRVGERCARANRPSACGPKRSRAYTSTA